MVLNMFDVQITLPRNSFTLNADISLPTDGVTAFYGHSGSGKTSLLRCIAGLERAHSAYICFHDKIWQDEKRFLPTHKRRIGYVFQEASLFEHLNARQNLLFAQQRAKGEAQLHFDHIIDLLGIETLLMRYPNQLSGGERQRVGIARALLTNPTLLLMDEPLASLDQKRKQDILPYLESLKRELDLPMLYVSHSAEEIARLADHIVVLDNGRVKQNGPLQDVLTVLDTPVKLGENTASVLEANIALRDSQWQLACIPINGGQLWFRDMGHCIGETVRIRVLARDVSLALEAHSDTSILNVLPATVVEFDQDEHAGITLVKLRVGNDYLLSRISSRSAMLLKLAPGMQLWAQIKSAAVIQ